MSTSYTSKTLICINTCLEDAESLHKIQQTDWFKKVKNSENYKVISVLSDPTVSASFTYEDKLIIKTEESYTNLCMKTYYMVDYFLQNTEHQYFIKVDCNLINGNHDDVSHLFSFDNFVDKFNSGSFEEEYGGACPILGTNPNHLRHWAASKNLTIMPELLLCELGIEEFPIKYWAGSSYSLSRGSAQKLHNTKKAFESFKNLMAGCEDLCFGTVLTKL